MTLFKSIPLALISAVLFSNLTFVQAAQAASDYEEVSYDDLLTELSAKRRTLTNTQTSSFDTVRIHAGVGYANSFTNISAQKQNFNRHATGIQVSLGMDLFSPNWYAEGVLRNFGVTTIGDEELDLRELDLKLGYTNKLENIWSFTLSTGLANRFLRFSDPTKNIDVNSTTPSVIVSTGFFAQVHKNISFGAEVSGHSAVISRTADKSSFDFAFRINTSL